MIYLKTEEGLAYCVSPRYPAYYFYALGREQKDRQGAKLKQGKPSKKADFGSKKNFVGKKVICYLKTEEAPAYCVS